MCCIFRVLNYQVMKIKSQLIYQSTCTCFHTKLPVYFYGLNNGKMVVLFASNITDYAFDNSLKWILAEHEDFSFDYDSGTIFTNGTEEVGMTEFMELADNIEQRVKILATFGNFTTNTEAQKYFNLNAYNMLISQNQVQFEMDYY